MLFSLQEMFDIFVMVAALGFIFKDSFVPPPPKDYDPLLSYRRKFDLDSLKFAVLAVAPGIVLHELGHKFVSIAAGIPATFHASYLWLSIGVMLKIANFPFIFIVPGYVTHSGSIPVVNLLVGFAGPFVNLVLWLGSMALIKMGFFRRHFLLLKVTQQINMYLFFFNMIPIAPFDGGHVFNSLVQIFS